MGKGGGGRGEWEFPTLQTIYSISASILTRPTRDEMANRPKGKKTSNSHPRFHSHTYQTDRQTDTPTPMT